MTVVPTGPGPVGEPALGATSAGAAADLALPLQDVLGVRESEPDVFVGARGARARAGIFGGQLAGQALAAAQQTADFPAHSLHGYFLQSGDPDIPVSYHVERLRDGRSSAVRRVVARQHDRRLFEVMASFTIPREGLDHADPAPSDVPDPESVADLPSHLAAWGFDGPLPPHFAVLDFRPVSVVSPLAPRAYPPSQQVWFRVRTPLGDDPRVHLQAITYASDLYLLATSLRPHGIASASPGVSFASLDHAIWFHRPFRADEWLLHDQHSPTASAGRGYSTGKIFRQDGTLVATTAQQGFIRPPAGAVGEQRPPTR
ncbi:acyl-CoA thioesterase [Frankia tisae]|uniref:acyl-CoA thioesterase n=1 Tax=Frankia tisae TaxID=2950104 RepID=UPI0021BEF8FA|nr:acyl-CoA thioesterase domain-containing protein [Frankia tisae]